MRAVLLICGLLAAANGCLAQGATPTDKGDAAHPEVAERLRRERPYKVDIRWMVPPVPIPLDWAVENDGQRQWEHAFEVTHVKFDHQDGVTHDAMPIRWTHNNRLDHTGDLAGEYVVAKKRN